MTQPVVKNNTSMTDLENFLKLVCFLYECFTRAFAAPILNDFDSVSSFREEIMIEVALDLEIDSSDYLGFVASANELHDSIFTKESLYESSIGKFYYEHFKPIDYHFMGKAKMEAFRKHKRKILNEHISRVMLVQVADDIQYALCNMEVVNSLSHKLNKYIAEHNCIVRYEIDFKIAYIELLNVFNQTGVSCNLYWIEGDSMDPDEAILKETIGHPTNVFETATTQDRSIVSKIAS